MHKKVAVFKFSWPNWNNRRLDAMSGPLVAMDEIHSIISIYRPKRLIKVLIYGSARHPSNDAPFGLIQNDQLYLALENFIRNSDIFIHIYFQINIKYKISYYILRLYKIIYYLKPSFLFNSLCFLLFFNLIGISSVIMYYDYISCTPKKI